MYQRRNTILNFDCSLDSYNNFVTYKRHKMFIFLYLSYTLFEFQWVKKKVESLIWQYLIIQMLKTIFDQIPNLFVSSFRKVWDTFNYFRHLRFRMQLKLQLEWFYCVWLWVQLLCTCFPGGLACITGFRRFLYLGNFPNIEN